MDLFLRGGRVVDPASGSDKLADVSIVAGKVAAIGAGLAAPSGARVIDVKDRVIAPGFVDLHVHFREPGHEYKEDIASGGRAAAAGGFTTVCAMPNTNPVNDCRAVTDLMTRRAREAGLVHVLPVGAVSKGLRGQELAEMGEMKEAGIVAVSDDGRGVMNAGLMRRALEYARTFDLIVVQHAEDEHLSADGVMNESAVSARMGLRGQPAAAESTMIARDIDLVAWTGTRYHVAHLSTARSVELLREAKKKGLPVTCEVTPHHLVLTDEACAGYDPNTKMAPPLREAADLARIKEALADGTVDAIATDHAPHSRVEKDVEFDCAAFGITGLETALPLVLRMVDEGVITLMRAIELLTIGPARAFALDGRGMGLLQVGQPADIAILDLDATYTVEADKMFSKSKNSPFLGWQMKGRAQLTLVGGKVVHDPDQVTA